MFEAIARTAFAAFKRRGAMQPAIWTPSSGEPACVGDVVRQRVESETSFSGEPAQLEIIDFIKSDFAGLEPPETIEIDGTPWVVRSIVSDDGVLVRAAIGRPDGAACT